MSRTNKMLIDASHPEETRVVVVRDGRVEEFDFESASRKPLRGNIYLAKITRVEPSLQAAFVEYGGNRHGFLAFNEIHPDYYQIPMADRMALLEEEAAQEAAEEAEADAHAERLARRRDGRQGRGGRNGGRNRGDRAPRGAASADDALADDQAVNDRALHEQISDQGQGSDDDYSSADNQYDGDDEGQDDTVTAAGGHEGGELDDREPMTRAAQARDADDVIREPVSDDRSDARNDDAVAGQSFEHGDEEENGDGSDDGSDDEGPVQVDAAPVEIDVIEPEGVEDLVEEVPQRPRRRMRSYKIQEVIKRRQVVLIQVVKEERGNKGAALTTYLSLAGRYTVLMPNTARGGGISRKITNPADRKRLKAAAQELDVPEGMGLIVRTAGASRTAQEIKRDFEYLLRLWESVRDLTLQSTAPTLVYEEGNLVKRSIRDLYNKDIDEIIVSGDAGYREAHDFMRMLTPSLAKNVIHYQGAEPLLARYRVEQQLAALFSPQVTLKSGGYIVINQTEALVAIDVNSGKSTREYSIEETALNTNLEAAEEIARQVKLRDLAGLIVIDFIDMEEKRNNRAVERRLKDSLRNDRARIQLGRISHFGLMEMSRQRLRTGVVEGSTSQCPHCQGSGIVRSIESIALAVLRGIEDALMSGTRMALVAHTTPQVALYILNSKRGYIIDMEARHGLPITVQGSDKLQGANFTIEKVAATSEPARRRIATPVNMEWGFDENGEEPGADEPVLDEVDADDEGGDETVAVRAEGGQQGEGRRRRRRRGRRGRRDERETSARDDYGTQPMGGYDGEEPAGGMIEEVGGPDGDADYGDDEDATEAPQQQRRAEGDREGSETRGGRRGRRRGRRGGRRGGPNGERSGPERSGGERDGENGDGASLSAGHQASGDGNVIAYLEDGSQAPVREEVAFDEFAGDSHVIDHQPRASRHDEATSVRQPEPEARTSGREHVHSEPSAEVETTPVTARHEPSSQAEVMDAVPEPAAATAPVVEAPVAEKPAQAAASAPAEAVTAEAPKPRRTASSSEPVLERVVVRTGQATGGEAGGDGTDVVRPRRGWWQKKAGQD